MIQKIASFFFYNSSRDYLRDFVIRAAKSLPEDAMVLDAGAGDCIYKEHFKAVHYESADFLQVDKPYAEVTHVCDLANIPVEDDRYDLVLFTQVMEHLPDPLKVLKELRRVLKPKGKLWLSAPFNYEEHEQPYDFYRYTQFGFAHLLKKGGFAVEELDWLEGYYGTVAYQMKSIAINLPVSPANYSGIFFKIFGPLMALIMKSISMILAYFYAKADRGFKYKKSGYCKNYCLIATPIEK